MGKLDAGLNVDFVGNSVDWKEDRGGKMVADEIVDSPDGIVDPVYSLESCQVVGIGEFEKFGVEVCLTRNVDVMG